MAGFPLRARFTINPVFDAFFNKSAVGLPASPDRKSTRLNSSHSQISYAVFCLKKKKSTRFLRALHPALVLMRLQAAHAPRRLGEGSPAARPDAGHHTVRPVRPGWLLHVQRVQ